jgi:hypothetical protein
MGTNWRPKKGKAIFDFFRKVKIARQIEVDEDEFSEGLGLDSEDVVLPDAGYPNLKNLTQEEILMLSKTHQPGQKENCTLI